MRFGSNFNLNWSSLLFLKLSLLSSLRFKLGRVGTLGGYLNLVSSLLIELSFRIGRVGTPGGRVGDPGG